MNTYIENLLEDSPNWKVSAFHGFLTKVKELAHTDEEKKFISDAEIAVDLVWKQRELEHRLSAAESISPEC